MDIFVRTDEGRLRVRSLDLQILFGDMFEVASSSSDVERILENIVGYAETLSEERLEELD